MIELSREVLDILSTVLIVAGTWGLVSILAVAGWSLIFGRFRGRR